MGKKTTRAFYLTTDLDEELRVAAARDHQSVSRFIADAVRAAIAKQNRRRQRDDREDEAA